ncbi:hypothetical protein Tco_0582316, partial [Tanacetum coccineum]
LPKRHSNSMINHISRGITRSTRPSPPPLPTLPPSDVSNTGSNKPGVADVALHISLSSKSKLAASKASARENKNGAELFKS